MMYDYVKHIRWAKLKVGAVITLALIILFLTVMFAGNIEEAFTPEVSIHAVVEDVKGLREGSPVWFSGVEIGSVKSIGFTEGNQVRITMAVDADVMAYLKEDSAANILTLGLLGDKYVEITPGTAVTDRLEAGGTIRGFTQTEIQDVVQTGQESIAKISDFVSLLENIIRRVEEGEGTIVKFMKDPAVYDNLKDAVHELTVLISKVEGGEGTIGRMVNDRGLYDNLSASVKDIQLFAKSLRESEGTVNRLISDPAVYERFNRAAESLDEFTSRLAVSKGTVNRLIEDEALYENMNDVSVKLAALLERIDRGEGLAGSLIRDDELSRELKTTVRELNVLIKDIRENPKNYFEFSIF